MATPMGRTRGRQQLSGAAGPGLAEADAQPFGPLAEEQRGDEEPRQDEEDVDAEEPAAGQRCSPVVEHDPEHGDGPQPVEGGHIAETDRTARVIGHRPGQPGVGRLGDSAHRFRFPGHARALYRSAPVHPSLPDSRRPAATTGFGRPVGRPRSAGGGKSDRQVDGLLL